MDTYLLGVVAAGLIITIAATCGLVFGRQHITQESKAIDPEAQAEWRRRHEAATKAAQEKALAEYDGAVDGLLRSSHDRSARASSWFLTPEKDDPRRVA